MQAPTCLLWISLIDDPAQIVETNGTSEKYSKLCPHNGERLMMQAEPRRTPTFSCLTSSPNDCPFLQVILD